MWQAPDNKQPDNRGLENMPLLEDFPPSMSCAAWDLGYQGYMAVGLTGLTGL